MNVENVHLHIKNVINNKTYTVIEVKTKEYSMRYLHHHITVQENQYKIRKLKIIIFQHVQD